MKTLRWILVIPSAIAGLLIAVQISGKIERLVDSYYAPPGKFSCIGTGHYCPFNEIVIFGASLAAVLTILCGVYMAPSHRPRVAKIILSIGAIIAVVLSLSFAQGGDITPFIALFFAIASGILTTFIIVRYAKYLHAT